MSQIKLVSNQLFNEFESATIEECVDFCKKQTEIGIDIETSRKYHRGIYPENVYKPGLDPYVSRIVMLQVGNLDTRYVIDARVINIQSLADVLSDSSILKVGHNLKFEGKFFLHNLGIEMRNVYDTMIAEKCISNGIDMRYSLAALSLKYLGIKPVESIDLFTDLKQMSSKYRTEDVSEEEAIAQAEQDLLEKEFIDKSTRMGFINIEDKPFTIKQIKYGAEDIVNPLLIKEKQQQAILEQGIDIGVYTENQFTQCLADMEYRGVPVDKSKWLDLYKRNYKIYLERLEFLNTYVEQNHLEFCGGNDLFSNRPLCLIEWSSSKQVIKLFKQLGIAVKERSKHTKKLEWTVGAKTLLRNLPGEYKGKFFKQEFPKHIESKEDLSLAYLLFKKSEQLVSTFGDKWLKYVHPITHRVHPNFNQYMQTGRLSSTNPNMQNIPNTSEFRACFVSKGTWLSSDYASQEVRVLAEVSEVQALQDFFKIGDPFYGDDFHSFMATMMFKVIHNDPDYIVPPKELPTGEDNPNFTKQHKEERNLSKQGTFKISFGGSGYTMAMDLGISTEEGEKFVDAWIDGFPGLRENFDQTKKLAIERGWIQLDRYTKKRYWFGRYKEMEDYRNKIYELYPNYNSLSKEQRKALPEYEDIKSYWRNYFYLLNKLQRKSLNYRIQGAAAMMMKIAILLVHRWRWDNNYQDIAYIMLPVHDEANAECLEPTITKEFREIIEQSMIKAGQYICPNVPMGADTEEANYWKH